MAKIHVKKGDDVVVLSGSEKGKRGKVIAVNPKAGRVIVEAASGRMPAFVDTGLNIVHVDDVAEGHWLAFERGRVGERYILGGEDMSLQAILAVVAELTGRRPPRLARRCRRWSCRRCRRIRRGELCARYRAHPCSHHRCCTGRQRYWRQDRRKPSGREEPGRRLLPAEGCAGGSERFAHTSATRIPIGNI